MADELISRQAAIGVLDVLIADSKRIAGDNELVQKTVNIQRAMRDIIAKLPAVDAVEVVRCKDCKYLYCLSAVDRRFYCRHWPKGLEGINVIEENPFCSYGERREENAPD